MIDSRGVTPDHFLPRSARGFTDATSPEQRLMIARELAGFAYAFTDRSISVPDLETRFAAEGLAFEWDVEEEERFSFTDEQIRAGARLALVFDIDRWFFRIRDALSQRIVFQGYMSWVLETFCPRI